MSLVRKTFQQQRLSLRYCTSSCPPTPPPTPGNSVFFGSPHFLTRVELQLMPLYVRRDTLSKIGVGYLRGAQQGKASHGGRNPGQVRGSVGRDASGEFDIFMLLAFSLVPLMIEQTNTHAHTPQGNATHSWRASIWRRRELELTCSSIP